MVSWTKCQVEHVLDLDQTKHLENPENTWLKVHQLPTKSIGCPISGTTVVVFMTGSARVLASNRGRLINWRQMQIPMRKLMPGQEDMIRKVEGSNPGNIFFLKDSLLKGTLFNHLDGKLYNVQVKDA